MYESPINAAIQDMVRRDMEWRENQIVYEVEKAIGVSVDKEELLKALKYDRGQYYKGYEDGRASAAVALEKQKPQKVTHEASLLRCCTCPRCKNVVDKFERFGETMMRVQYKYCHFCGQALDWEGEQ